MHAPSNVQEGRPWISAIIPALDEEDAIGKVLRDLPNAWTDEVIVVDNGSADRTAEVARRCGARVVREPERGYGAACLRGIAALSPGCGIVVFLDADYSDYPEEISRLIAPILADEADLVIGTRTGDPASRAAMARRQLWGNRLAAALIRLRFRERYSDLGPFRAIRRDALARLGMADRNYGWTVEMQIRAVRAGLRITEVPVRYRRRTGRSKISGTVGGTLRAGSKILYTVGREALTTRSWLRRTASVPGPQSR